MHILRFNMNGRNSISTPPKCYYWYIYIHIRTQCGCSWSMERTLSMFPEADAFKRAFGDEGSLADNCRERVRNTGI